MNLFWYFKAFETDDFSGEKSQKIDFQNFVSDWANFEIKRRRKSRFRIIKVFRLLSEKKTNTIFCEKLVFFEKYCKIRVISMRQVKNQINKQIFFHLTFSCLIATFIIMKTGNDYINVQIINANIPFPSSNVLDILTPTENPSSTAK